MGVRSGADDHSVPLRLGDRAFSVDVGAGSAGDPQTLGVLGEFPLYEVRVREHNGLWILGGSAIDLTLGFGNSHPRPFAVDGVVELDGKLRATRSFAIEGSGTIELGGAGSGIEVQTGGPFFDRLDPFEIGPSVTLRGGGSLFGQRGVANYGLLIAEGDTQLVIESVIEDGPFGAPQEGASFDNFATVEVVGAGGFEAFGVRNWGEVNVRSGSAINHLWQFENWDRLNIDEGGTFFIEDRDHFLTGIDSYGDIRVAGRIANAEGVSSGVNNRGFLEVAETGSIMASFANSASHLDVIPVSIVAGRVEGGVNIAYGSLVLRGGEMSSGDSRFTINRQGVLVGSGSIASDRFVALLGEVSPGEGGAGTLDITGLTGFDGDLRLDLSPETGEHDVVRVLGTSILSGTVTLNVLDQDYVPTMGEAFDLLFATAIDASQGFDLRTTRALGEGFSWVTRIVSGPEGQRLQAVVAPEPGSGVLLAVGLAALVFRRKRGVPAIGSP